MRLKGCLQVIKNGIHPGEDLQAPKHTYVAANVEDSNAWPATTTSASSDRYTADVGGQPHTQPHADCKRGRDGKKGERDAVLSSSSTLIQEGRSDNDRGVENNFCAFKSLQDISTRPFRCNFCSGIIMVVKSKVWSLRLADRDKDVSLNPSVPRISAEMLFVYSDLTMTDCRTRRECR